MLIEERFVIQNIVSPQSLHPGDGKFIFALPVLIDAGLLKTAKRVS
jgi:hypothetical protein